VYRGVRSSLPVGGYVYGDYCTGEIFVYQNGSSRVVLDTALSISSFGEDESREIYVVDLGGTVKRIGKGMPCTFSLSPTSRSAPVQGVHRVVVHVAAPPGCGWTATSGDPWITVTRGQSGTGRAPVTFSVASNRGNASLRTGTLTVAGQTFTVTQAGQP